MSDYFGTDEDDIIDASILDSDVRRIYHGKGEDTITGSNFDYAFWDAEQGVTINLKEGWSEDGFGTRDTVSGVITIHGSGFGDTFYGTDNYEKFFANGGDNILNMGIGDDMVSYAPGRGASTDYTITNVGDEVHVTGPNTKDIII